MKNFLKREHAGHYFSENISVVAIISSIFFAAALTGMLLGGHFVETALFAGLIGLLIIHFAEIGQKLDYQKIEVAESKKNRFFALEEEDREASILTTAVD